MKSIKITYFEPNEDNNKNSIMEVALDFPIWKDIKKCYLYELFYFDTVESKIQDYENNNIRYNVFNFDITPFFIKVDDNIYQEMVEYFKNPTEYENCKWNDDCAFLNAVLDIYRNDPKSWET